MRCPCGLLRRAIQTDTGGVGNADSLVRPEWAANRAQYGHSDWRHMGDQKSRQVGCASIGNSRHGARRDLRQQLASFEANLIGMGEPEFVVVGKVTGYLCLAPPLPGTKTHLIEPLVDRDGEAEVLPKERGGLERAPN